jgi:hypothetical protein
MTTLYIGKRQKIDPEIVNRNREYFEGKNKPGWADSVAKHSWKPKKIPILENELNPLNKLMLVKYLLKNLSEGVYHVNGNITGVMGRKYLGTYCIYKKNGKPNIMDWKKYKRLYGD